MPDVVNNLAEGGDLREKLITTAVKFLTNPDVLRLTNANKEQFLRNKGLSEAEIRAAVAKASELLNFQTFSTDLMLFRNRRSSWFRDNVLPLVVYGAAAYGAYWFYKNFLRRVLFVERPKSKSTEECLGEVTASLEALAGGVEALRREVAEAGAARRAAALRTQLDQLKAEITSVKGILVNRNQFPSLKTRSSPPSIPAWQRQSVEATSTAPPHEEPPRSPPSPASPAQRGRSQRSESGGSNSSEGEHATKNSDSSLEIIT